MEKGINLALTKSLADFDALLDKAIEAVSSKKLTVPPELHGLNVWQLQVGKYVQINDEDMEGVFPIFWIGYGWEENDGHESMLWLEFDAKTCPPKYWGKLEELAGTSGKYCSKIEFEFVQVYMNAWVHFYLGDEHLERFYDENADPNNQREILTCFMNEVLDKIQGIGPAQMSALGNEQVGAVKKTSSRKSIPLAALERLYVIDREIASGRYPNTNDLVECLKRADGECKPASNATVGRDIAFMKDRLGAPIEYDPVERGYYYAKEVPTTRDFHRRLGFRGW